MTDKDLAPYDENTPRIHSNIGINMQELVSVGLSEMETKLHGYIKDLQSDVNTLKKDIKADTATIQKICEESIPKSFIDLKSYLDAAKLDKYVVKISSTYSIPEGNQKNQYECKLCSQAKGYYNQSDTTLKTEEFPITKKQIKLFKQIAADGDIITNKQAKIVLYRRQLGDMGRMERKMKARIVKTQLDKTDDGKKLLASFMDSFDQDLKALE